MRSVVYGFIWALILPVFCSGQNYHAIEGSPFAGSLGVANNPASMLSAPDAWDITLFSTQIKNTTNAVVLHNWSLLSSGDTIGYQWKSGNLRRFIAFDFNVHLFNARINLGRRQAIAFGANIRGYGAVRTGLANYSDSLQDMNQFFNINPNTVYGGNMSTSSWIELFATYSRTIIDDEMRRVNAGITLRAMRGISGAFVQLEAGGVARATQGTETIYFMKAGTTRYGYSANYDRWRNGNSTGRNLRDFLGASRPGAALDLGLEYWIKRQAVIPNAEKDDAYYDYEWKIGVALLDVGRNVYRYGSQSRSASQPRSDVSDVDLNLKFDSTGSLAEFNDSLATIVNNISTPSGNFSIWNPMRLVINVDRPLRDNFSINANLTLNMPWKNTNKRLVVKDLSFLTLTPRWEKKNLGLYMPINITTDGKFWVGGAGKAGPLILGFHNLRNLVSKSSMQNGGLYLALVIRPGGGGFKQKEDKRYDCPPY